jgi:hypothetical protein
MPVVIGWQFLDLRVAYSTAAVLRPVRLAARIRSKGKRRA